MWVKKMVASTQGSRQSLERLNQFELQFYWLMELTINSYSSLGTFDATLTQILGIGEFQFFFVIIFFATRLLGIRFAPLIQHLLILFEEKKEGNSNFVIPRNPPKE